MTITTHVVNYAAQECEWQGSGEMSVAWMIDGWLYAGERRNHRITYENIIVLGRCIEPNKNRRGIRKVGVRVGWDVKLDPALVDSALRKLIKTTPDDPSEAECVEWFRQYEKIHPFFDGNGRTGTLLYNWLRGSLLEPIHAPNLWHDPRRDAVQAHTP